MSVVRFVLVLESRESESYEKDFFNESDGRSRQVDIRALFESEVPCLLSKSSDEVRWTAEERPEIPMQLEYLPSSFSSFSQSTLSSRKNVSLYFRFHFFS